jgi:hypothetical protein
MVVYLNSSLEIQNILKVLEVLVVLVVMVGLSLLLLDLMVVQQKSCPPFWAFMYAHSQVVSELGVWTSNQQ